jgi:hypothetical protein
MTKRRSLLPASPLYALAGCLVACGITTAVTNAAKDGGIGSATDDGGHALDDGTIFDSPMGARDAVTGDAATKDSDPVSTADATCQTFTPGSVVGLPGKECGFQPGIANICTGGCGFPPYLYICNLDSGGPGISGCTSVISHPSNPANPAAPVPGFSCCPVVECTITVAYAGFCAMPKVARRCTPLLGQPWPTDHGCVLIDDAGPGAGLSCCDS